MRRPRRLLLAALIALASWPALAEHEVDHRYTLRGFVLGANQDPLAGQPVAILSGGRAIGSATTDSSGYYTVRLHLHNPDLGTRLLVRAGGAEGEVRVSFDPGDTSTSRIHYVNFIEGKLVEGELRGMGFPAWGYPLAGVAAIGAIVLLLGPVRRGLRRRRRAESPVATKRVAPSSTRTKRRKRKRR